MRKPRRQPRTKQAEMRFVTTSQQTTRLELIVDFNSPVSVLEANRVLRNVMEKLEVSIGGIEVPAEFAGASLRSSEFKQIIQIGVDRVD